MILPAAVPPGPARRPAARVSPFPGAAPLNALAYVLGGILVLPVLLRHRCRGSS